MRVFPILIVAALMGHGMMVSSATDPVPPTAISLSAVQQETFEWSGSISAGRAIEIRGINGPIRATAGGSEVAVTATKKAGRRGAAEDVTFEVVEHDGGVTICAMYPSDPDEDPNECRPGGHGHMSVHENDTRVDFTVRVPAGVNLVASTINGAIEATGLGAKVNAYTVNGRVEVETAGVVEARTVNGSVDVRMGSADWRGDLEIATVNGGITIVMPADVSAEVKASMVTGGFDSDFPLTVQGKWGPKQVSGTIGDGGRTLRLSTVTGGIRLRRGR
jgi:DUF4097 and DUF4098 domain-containing protein YvlB